MVQQTVGTPSLRHAAVILRSRRMIIIRWQNRKGNGAHPRPGEVGVSAPEMLMKLIKELAGPVLAAVVLAMLLLTVIQPTIIREDSMLPNYHDGDYVYVQHTNTLRYGEVGIFIVAGAPYIKEYRKSGLYSYNKNYRIMKLNEDDDVRLVGRVLGHVEEGDMLQGMLKEL